MPKIRKPDLKIEQRTCPMCCPMRYPMHCPMLTKSALQGTMWADRPASNATCPMTIGQSNAYRKEYKC